jgi:ParB family chromosome partitioning protein
MMIRNDYEYTRVPVAILHPYTKNSRTHSDEQIEQLIKSIKEFGFTNPILIDPSRNVIAGHARLQAAKILNLPEVPCITLYGLSDEQKKAYVIADNKLALNAEWDIQTLISEVEDLEDAGYEVGLIGFSKDELEDFSESKIEELDTEKVSDHKDKTKSCPQCGYQYGKI